MKVLNITKKFENNSYAGIETLIDNLSAGLLKEGIRSDVFTLKYKKIKKKLYKVYSYRILFSFFSCPISLEAFFKFKKIAKNYDIFNFHFPWPFMDVLSFFIPRDKIIITYHSDITQRNIFFYLYFPLMIFFLVRSKYIITTSKQYLNSSWILKIFYNKVKIIPIGINPKKNQKKNIEINYLNKRKYFIFVGNLRNYKGLNFLINAFKKLNYTLLICGNGKLLNFVKSKTKNINEFKKTELIKRSLCLILPSIDRREAYGVVLLEALSLKKPLITTNLKTATSFINLHNKTGFVCKPKCEKELITYSKIIYENSFLRKKFSKNAYQRFTSLFTEEKMIKRYIRLFKSF